MKKKFLLVFIAILAEVVCFGLAACGGSNTEYGDSGNNPPSTHEHNYTSSVTGPTCTERGYTLYTCACGDSYKDDYVNATGHTEVTDKAVAATCTEKGKTEGKHCSVCSTVLVAQTEVAAKGHKYKNKKCTVCGADKPESSGLAFKLSEDEQSYSVTGIGECKDTQIFIPEDYEGKPVTSIGERAFYYCSGLTSITIPDSVTSIDGDAFRGCNSLTNITIPDSVTIINDYAFYGCNSLTNITIPDSVTIIGDYAFYGCNSLTNITIPDGVTSISDYAFGGCSSLKSVTIPDGVTRIGSFAFVDCSALKSIIIPDSVIEMGESILKGCDSLESVTIPFVNNLEGSPHENSARPFAAIFGMAKHDWDIIQNERKYYFPKNLKSVTVTGGQLPWYAFDNCSKLTNITLGNNVTFIGYNAFRGCSGLTSIKIGDGVTSIIDYAFNGCISLTSIIIPICVTSIWAYAFANCEKLTIYCEAESKPEGWSDKWNYFNSKVVWGYKSKN